MACRMCKTGDTQRDIGVYYTVHAECFDKPLQAYGVFADVERHIERGDPMPNVHVLPVDNGKYYLREDVDRLLGRTP